jgi:LAO/AO transport system kinase
MGAVAKRARADVEGALGLAEAGDWPVEVLSLAALRGEGVEPLIAALDRRWAWLAEAGRLQRQRQAQARQWVVEGIRQRFGREGLKRAGEVTLQEGKSPFARLADIGRRIQLTGADDSAP